MSSSNKEPLILERLFRSLTEETAPHKLRSGITDLFIRINQETGEISLYGDDDELITSTVIFSWVGKEPKHFEKVSRSIKDILNKLQHEGYWEQDVFERPFSIELVTESFETIEELLFIDDELVQVTTPLLDNLDAELSAFIDKLMTD